MPKDQVAPGVERLRFEPLEAVHLDLLFEWFSRPHMIESWGAARTRADVERKYGPRIRGEEPVTVFVVVMDERPIGYVQYYAVADSLPDGIVDPSASELFARYRAEELAGMDCFIGEPELLGQGIGRAMVRQFVDELLLPRFRAVVIDPKAANARAIRAYEHAGFRRTAYSQDPAYVILMRER